MASRRPSTRENNKGPPVTPISDPKEILRRARASLRQTSRATKEATSGISRDISTIISSAETFKSQEFIDTSENFRIEEFSSIVACEDVIPGDSMKDEFSGDSEILRCQKNLLICLSKPQNSENFKNLKITYNLIKCSH